MDYVLRGFPARLKLTSRHAGVLTSSRTYVDAAASLWALGRPGKARQRSAHFAMDIAPVTKYCAKDLALETLAERRRLRTESGGLGLLRRASVTFLPL